MHSLARMRRAEHASAGRGKARLWLLLLCMLSVRMQRQADAAMTASPAAAAQQAYSFATQTVQSRDGTAARLLRSRPKTTQTTTSMTHTCWHAGSVAETVVAVAANKPTLTCLGHAVQPAGSAQNSPNYHAMMRSSSSCSYRRQVDSHTVQSYGAAKDRVHVACTACKCQAKACAGLAHAVMASPAVCCGNCNRSLSRSGNACCSCRC